MKVRNFRFRDPPRGCEKDETSAGFDEGDNEETYVRELEGTKEVGDSASGTIDDQRQSQHSTARERECRGDENSLLEGRSDGSDFVDDIFDRDDTVLAERLLDDGVGGKGDTLLVDLSVTSLVDEFSDSLEVRLSATMRRVSTTSGGGKSNARRTRR